MVRKKRRKKKTKRQYEWDVSPHWVSDASANRKSNISPKKKSGFKPRRTIEVGNEGISVKLLHMTSLSKFLKPLAYMVNATVGGTPPKGKIGEVAKEMFKGGLQHGLESIQMVFEIKGVSRAFTHQVVRHRKWGFHQQSFRWSYLRDTNLGIRISPNVAEDSELYEAVRKHWENTKILYKKLVDANVPFQDCRDILPIGTQTYIIAECNLREFMNTFSYRGCSMFQPQMVHVIWQMRNRIVERHPELEPFLKLSCQKNKVCMYQGWEDVSEGCKLPYTKKKQFKSEVYK